MERIWWVERYRLEVLLFKLYDVSVNKYGVQCETSLRFWENNGWINSMDP